MPWWDLQNCTKVCFTLCNHSLHLICISDEMMVEVDSFKGIELATNTCVHYNPLGQAPYPYASGPYLS